MEITRCGKGTKREKARDELSFLHEQLNILYRDKRWEKQLDPTLVKKVSEKPASTSSRKSTETFDLRVEKASAQPASRPAYVRKCRKMSFRQLREFIDDSLRAFPESTSDSEAPNSYDEFIELWEMLRKKVNVPELPPMPPKPGPTPEFPEFVASEQLKQQLQASFDQQEQLKAKLATTTEDSVIKELQYQLELSNRSIATLRNQEKQDHERERDAHISQFEDAQSVYKRGMQEREAEKKRQRELRPSRVQITERIGKDIERAFTPGAMMTRSSLPWRILPPGELTLDKVLKHYGRLQQQGPDIRYDRERITKAFSLRPSKCYVGKDEYEGYIVFTFDHTQRVLMECPIFGNAIYILGPNWKRLSRLSKRDLLVRTDTVKIVHKGDWFTRVKRELRK